MAVVNTEPKFSKRRKLGKNKKKAWRVSKVDDIEEYLADERRQLRTGGLVSEKSNDTLFVLDTGKKQAEDVSSGPVNKRSKQHKPLKCLALLQSSSFIKPPRIPDQDGFQKGKRSQRVVERQQKKSHSAIRLAGEEQRKKTVEQRETERARKRKLPEIDGDLWADDAKAENTVKRPKGLRKKPSALSATAVPHSGASFNPSYMDHQNLLCEALVTEVAKEKKQRKIHNSLDAMFPSKEEQRINQILHMREMAAGLFEDSDDDDDDDDESDEEEEQSLSVGAPVRREDRKTKKQKRNEKNEKQLVKQRSAVNDVKKRENMILRIPTLKAEINKAERKTQQRIAQRKKKRELRQFKTKRLNTVQYEEPDVDLKLSSELVGSLREVKPEGHVMQDVYKSLQKRNIIEPRVRQKNKRKYKKKVFEKKGHKAVTL